MKYLLSIFSFVLISCFSVPQSGSNTYPNPSTNTTVNEAAEFASLMEKDKIGKDQRIAESLNILLNNDPTVTKAVLSFNNKTNCDIILRIFGSTDYLLPVAKNGKNFVVLEKGYYNLKYYVCNAANTEHLNISDSKEFTISEK